MVTYAPSDISFVVDSMASDHSILKGAKKGLLKKVGIQPAVKVESTEKIDERPKKGLQWNISPMTWTQELRQMREEKLRRRAEAPGSTMLLSIPKDRFHHWHFRYEDMSYHPYGLDLSHMKVQDIRVIVSLKHLSMLDLSYNDMKNDSLAILEELKYLNYINLDHNQLISMDIPGSSNIRWFSMRNNDMVWIEPFTMPMLEYIHLDNNYIRNLENFDIENTPLIRLLSVKGNRLIVIKDSKLSPSLRYLYLGNNKIRNCEGLNHLVNLRVLHLRSNKIKKVKTITSEFRNLCYLNLRDNYIANVRQFRKLKPLPNLRILVTTGCPFEKDNPEKARLGVIYYLPNLKRLNKKDVTDSERETSKSLSDELDPEGDSSEDDVPEDAVEYTDHPIDPDEEKALKNTAEESTPQPPPPSTPTETASSTGESQSFTGSTP
ncbi:leucine-rich repeat-containing protein 23-like [Cimex lectularius]|uniref:Uncharacterized protein n=1 Tax=Cimex lectularius TaxID=79782 RepID=A0A8I6R7M9_CIMLE|nr:leucine-rich repeat-containing protein 23-like [Cimex lectularius]